ncbi:MAG TPA: hypothetical protein VHI13_16730 [Candidatus Kapabacteria bacterium]|nr:hypothetical protein [Candidatus Kapabacteria bacterium]
MRTLLLFICLLVTAASLFAQQQPTLSFKGIRVGMTVAELRTWLAESNFEPLRENLDTARNVILRPQAQDTVAGRSIGSATSCIYLNSVHVGLYHGTVYAIYATLTDINGNSESRIKDDVDILVAALTDRYGASRSHHTVTQRAIDSAHYKRHYYPHFAEWKWFTTQQRKRITTHSIDVYLTYSESADRFTIWVSMTDDVALKRAADEELQESDREEQQRQKQRDYDRAHPKMQTKF